MEMNIQTHYRDFHGCRFFMYIVIYSFTGEWVLVWGGTLTLYQHSQIRPPFFFEK